jgi:hypothetical protein
MVRAKGQEKQKSCRFLDQGSVAFAGYGVISKPDLRNWRKKTKNK